MAKPSHVPVPLAAVHASISEQLHRRLRTAIIRGDIAPGQTLSETEIGRSYAVSRQPVREAFIKLAQEGLLEVVPNRGTRVRRISMREALDARFVREAVEAAVAREAALHATADDVATLRRLVAGQRAVAPEDADAFLALDEAFHRALAVAARREHAWAAIEGLKARMDRARYLSLDRATPLALIVRQHKAIVDAVARHAPDGAEAAMRTHLQELQSSLPAVAAANPDAFIRDLPDPATV